MPVEMPVGADVGEVGRLGGSRGKTKMQKHPLRPRYMHQITHPFSL